MHHLSSRPGYSRGISRKSANGSNGNVSQHRPTVPPSYNMAIAKRNESKQLEVVKVSLFLFFSFSYKLFSLL